MKKWMLIMLALLLLAILPAMAGADTVTAFGKTFDTSLEVLDLDAEGLVFRDDIRELRALLDKMPALKEVWMYNSKLSRELTDELFDSYPDIFFGWTLKLYTHTVRTDQTAFSTLHGHEGVDGDPFHNSKQLSMMRYCKRMKALDLGHNYLSDLDFLAEMPQLKVLIIAANYHMHDALAPLAALTELEYLEIFSTHTIDVTPLAGLTKLRDLNMTNNQCTDLSPLYDLPNLERFWGGMMPVSDQQKREMERAHPNCEFDWVSMPTLGTWRTHPHYDTIYTIFHTNKYIPFSE